MATRTVAAGGGASNAAATFVEAAVLATGDDLVIDAASGSLTFTGNYTLNSVTINGGTGTAKPLVSSSVIGTARTITSDSFSINNVDFMDITFGSAADIDLSATLVGDCGGNSITGGGVLTFPASVTQTWDGTTGNFSDADKWTSRIPLPQDDVVLAGTNVCTFDMARIGRSISFSAACPLTLATSVTSYGSLDFTGAGTFTHVNKTWYFMGRGEYLLTSAGNSFRSIIYSAPGGSLTLLSSLDANALAIQAGTFNQSSYTITTAVDTSMSVGTTINGSGAWTVGGRIVLVGNWNATGSINLTSASATNRNHNFGTSRTIPNNITITGGGAGICYLQATTSVTFTGLVTVNYPKTVKFTSGVQYNFSQAPVLQGTSGNLITLLASTGGSAAALNKSGGVVLCRYVDITDINVTSPATWFYDANSVWHSGTGWRRSGGDRRGFLPSFAPAFVPAFNAPAWSH